MKQTFSDLINGEKPTLVDFSAEWCGPCKMLAPILEQVKGRLSEEVKIIKVDVDKNPTAAMNYQIQGVPTMILFRKGKMLWRQSGVLSAHEIEKAVRSRIV